MSQPGFYNDNQNRDYPFVPRVRPLTGASGFDPEADGDLAVLPQGLLLDCGIIMGLEARFDESAGHTTYLHSISRTGNDVTFSLRTTAPLADGYELVFVCDVNDPPYTIHRNEATSFAPELLDPVGCGEQPRWSGFLVVGDLAGPDVPGDGQTIVFIPNLWQLEPARIQNLMQSYAAGISLANHPRLTVTPFAGCESSVGSEEPDEALDVILQATCLTGRLIWKEGFNCVIRQDVGNNAIVIGAGVGAGAGQPCEEIPLFDEESPPDGGELLSGGPTCNDVVRAINGVSGRDISLLAGPGFRIQPDEENPHKLIVSFNAGDFAQCS